MLYSPALVGYGTRMLPLPVRLAIAVCLALPLPLSAEELHPRPPDPEPSHGEPQGISDRKIQASLLEALELFSIPEKAPTASELLKAIPAGPATLSLAAPSSRPLEGPALCERLLQSTGIVAGRYKCDKCSKWHLSTASGFFLTADGAFVTNHHVLSRAKEKKGVFAVMDHRGRSFPVIRILAADPAHDVVILKVAGEGFLSLPLAPEQSIRSGLPIAAMGHPRSMFFVYTTGVITRMAEFPSHIPGNAPYEVLCITADFAPGSSGGPAVDPCGNVCGLTQRILPIEEGKATGNDYTAMMIRLAVPAGRIRALVCPPAP